MTRDLNLSVQLRRDFAAPVERLFEAWSDPVFFAQWWKNLEVAELDVQEGGRLLLRWLTWDGHVEGEYIVVKPNEEIAFTWRAVPPMEGEKESLVRIRFESLGPDRCRLSLDHDLNRTSEEHASHLSGWQSALRDLAETFTRTLSPVRVERHLSASPERVFQALTTGAEMDGWFFTRCEATPEVGERFSIAWESDTNAAANHVRSGRYLEVDPGRRLTFEWGGLALDSEEPSTKVCITLTARDGGTDLVLEHTGWGEGDTWMASRDQHESGWCFYMDNLGRYVAGRADLRSTMGQRVQSAA